MCKVLVSAIITTYKRTPCIIERAIKSVLNQTHRNLELIIVDDSPDSYTQRKDVSKMIQSLTDNRITYIQHRENQGACAARNTGIRNSRGNYIAFLDDDDEWLKQKLELQIKKFYESQVSNLGLVYCGRFRLTYKNGEKTNEIELPLISPYENVMYLLYQKNFIGSTSFSLIKKEVFDEVGYFDESLDAKQDYDMWIRIVKRYGIDYVPNPLCNYYAHLGERITTNVSKKLKAEKQFLNKHYDGIKQSKKNLGLKYKIIGRLNFKMRDFTNARVFFGKSLKLNPTSVIIYVWFILSLLRYEPKFTRKNS